MIVKTQMVTGIACCETHGVAKVRIFDHVRANACRCMQIPGLRKASRTQVHTEPTPMSFID